MSKAGKHIRGTAIVVRDGKVLLVRDRGVGPFSLPGGRRKGPHEPFLCIAVRELYEELRLTAKKAERLPECDYDSAHNHHKVTLIETDREPELPQGGEIEEYLWWDQVSGVRRFPSVDAILQNVRADVFG